MIHINIFSQMTKNNSPTNSNQALVFWEDLNYPNDHSFKNYIKISLMEEQSALLLWSIRSMNDLLGFELLYKDRSSMITETADEDNI